MTDIVKDYPKADPRSYTSRRNKGYDTYIRTNDVDIADSELVILRLSCKTRYKSGICQNNSKKITEVSEILQNIPKSYNIRVTNPSTLYYVL